MPSGNHGLSARSLAELALIVSRLARSVIDDSIVPSVGSLQSFWQNSRTLQQRWAKSLHGWTSADSPDVEFLENLAPRVFACEMLVRTWGTALVALDRRCGTDDLTYVARSAVVGLQQIRHGILSRLLGLPESMNDRVMQVDRLRRRCDRWTDLLIGPIAFKSDCFEFAFDTERSRDFGEEGSIADPATGPHPIEHLVSAGLRLTFLKHLSPANLEEPEFAGLTQSVLSSLPECAFHRDGSLRSSLEKRVEVSHRQIEHRPDFQLASLLSGQDHVAPRR